MKLYYKYIYMPPKIENYPETVFNKILFSNHALEALVDDDLQAFDELVFSGKNILEAGTDENERIVYCLLEIPHNYKENMYVALALRYKKNDFSIVDYVRVITVYVADHCDLAIINKTDNKYYRPLNMSFEREF